MQITGGAVGAQALDQLEELGAVRSLTSKVSAADRSCVELYPERDMYLDMDIALPFHWESLTGKGHKLSNSSDSQEFEFNMSGVSVNPGSDTVTAEDISPADELFYKGQLLPLHLPKRLQMVQKLSSPKQADKASVTVSCFFQPSTLKYSPLASDEGYLGSALVNSRSSSFHSQSSNNFWDSPGELDSGDSSRDSSGSSQDACVPPEKQALPKFQHEDYLSRSSHNLRSEKSLFSSWLRTPFKWKVFFGLKKPNNSKASSTKGGTKLPRSSRSGSYFSAEQGIGSRKEFSDLEYQGGLFSFPAADRDRGSAPSKAPRDSLHKYLNILKPLSNVKGREQAESLRMVDIKSKSSSFSGSLSASSPKYSLSPKAVFSNNLSSPKSSFSEQRCRSPTMHSLSGNLRVPSFSRSSKASNAVGQAASPHHSGLLNSSPSAMAELHSAIQGAIAHCKQSQTGL